VGFLRRKPSFQLTGLTATGDGLYDGSFLLACVRWWNHEVETRADVRAAGHRPFREEEAHELCAVVQPRNRGAFEAFASAVSMPGRFSTAVLNLAYALALVIDAGAAQIGDEPDRAVQTQAPPFTEEDLTELERHYSQEGAAKEYETWVPFWLAAPTVFEGRIGEKLVASARIVFDDQIDRWSTAEGFDLRASIGAPDWSLTAFSDDENVRLPNFVELLFEWGGRLRLGERFLADRHVLADHRFADDDGSFGVIDHLYAEAYQRYIELASQVPPPISDDIEMAVGTCATWLGESLDARARTGVSTAAIRGYLWRTVEGGAVDFLEPALTEAVERSRGVGDDRAEDEPRGLTYYSAASQCMVDEVNTRFGSIGGIINGPRSYEKALRDTTVDFKEHGLDLAEETKRLAFNFGVCLADSERVLGDREHTTYMS
jgi:hypothetical protein